MFCNDAGARGHGGNTGQIAIVMIRITANDPEPIAKRIHGSQIQLGRRGWIERRALQDRDVFRAGFTRQSDGLFDFFKMRHAGRQNKRKARCRTLLHQG